MRADNPHTVVLGETHQSTACKAGAEQAGVRAKAQKVGQRAVRANGTARVARVQPPTTFCAYGNTGVSEVVSWQRYQENIFGLAYDSLNAAYAKPGHVAVVPGLPARIVSPMLVPIAPRSLYVRLRDYDSLRMDVHGGFRKVGEPPVCSECKCVMMMWRTSDGVKPRLRIW